MYQVKFLTSRIV